MDDNKILITDENGKEVEMNILFTFDSNNKNYLVCYKEDDEDSVYSFSYDEKGNLYMIEDNDELSMIQEVIDSFDEEDNEKTKKV